MYATGSHQGNLIVTQCREQEGKLKEKCLTCFDAGNIFK